MLLHEGQRAGEITSITESPPVFAPVTARRYLVQGDGQAGKVWDMSFDHFKVPRAVH